MKRIKKFLALCLCLLFISCSYHMVFVNELSELKDFGIDKSQVKKVEQVYTGNSSKLYKVYYKYKD